MRRRVLAVAAAAGSLALAVSTAQDKREVVSIEARPPGEKTAVATIEPRSGSSVEGRAVFTQTDGQVTLRLELRKLPPGVHAVHLHEVGDCTAPDASSAGSHWNPTRAEHGKWGAVPFHLGDIGNVSAASDGSAAFAMTTDQWRVGDGSTRDVVGRSVVVHEKADDFKTQPTGAAGGRIGCGVVRLDS